MDRMEVEHLIERLEGCTGGLTNTRVCLPVHALEIGMHVDALDKPWLESSFLFQGFFITAREEIELLKSECKYVYITLTHETVDSNSAKYTGNRRRTMAVGALRQAKTNRHLALV